jgi:hypothetical protein
MIMEIPKEEWEAVKSSIQRMETALMGDEKMGVWGMTHRVGHHEKKFKDFEDKISDQDKKFEKIEEVKNKGYGFMAAFAILSGLIGTGLWESFKHLLFPK